MKSLLAALISLVIGIAIGWFFGFTRIADMEVKAALKTGHRDDATATLYACRFFQLNDAGQTQEGLKFMAEPIGSYYRIYKNRSVSQRDADLISFIEQLASTNQIIAAEIYKKKN